MSKYIDIISCFHPQLVSSTNSHSACAFPTDQESGSMSTSNAGGGETAQNNEEGIAVFSV